MRPIDKKDDLNYSFWFFLLQIVEDESLLSEKGLVLKKQVERGEIEVPIQEKLNIVKMFQQEGSLNSHISR